jgi:hypothetical protein
MAKWTQTLSSKKPCRIKRDQIVAVVDKKKGHVEVFLRGGHSLVVEGTIEIFAPDAEGVQLLRTSQSAA